MSEFYLRKMRTFFHHLDYDGDNSITQKDFEDIAHRFIAKGTLSKEKGDELMDKLIKVCALHNFSEFLSLEHSEECFDVALNAIGLIFCSQNATFLTTRFFNPVCKS